jgi:uroporphyrinogen III methyltransferase/synthase
MTEPAPSTPDDRDATGQAAAPTPRGRRRIAWVALAITALLLVIGYALLDARRQARVQAQLAETRAHEAAEATARAQAAAAQAQEAQKKLAEIEQAAAAEEETPAGPGREDALLLEVERLVLLAAGDLQLTRHNATALAALELADARLAAAGAPRLAPLRRALARDLERLRALPVVDVTGSALKLDQMIAGADVWPLVTAPAAPPAAPPKPTPRGAAKKADVVEPAPAAPTAWASVRAWLAAEFGDLVRISEVPTPEALLLNNEQGRLVRQQLKLRLLGARLALLARNDRLYHADLENSQTLLALYFDGRHAAVAAAAATLRQLNAIALAYEVPTLADSQAAVRAARVRR